MGNWPFPRAAPREHRVEEGVEDEDLLVGELRAVGDGQFSFQLLLQSWFFLTPIMYPLEVLPTRYQWLMVLNPMYHLVEMFRAPIIAGTLPALDHFLWAAGWAGGVLLLGWFTITRKANEFAYRI